MFGRKKKFYLTTTLPYVNADPHIGFALEIIQADVIARFRKKQGYEVFFNTGTDEHGLKILRKAQEEQIDPKKYCDIYAEKNKKLKSALNLSYTNFIRTTDEHHIRAAQEFWSRCADSGDIYKKAYKIKYCVGCELEKTESELENGRCPIHPDRQLEEIEEENYFFRYSKYQNKLLELYKKNANFVIPQSRQNEITEFTKNGLKDFSISRLKEKMSWGIEVPNDRNHVMYVWFDALVNYISALGWPDDPKFKEFWPGTQFAGKDNLRQQSSMWQAMLLSAGLPLSKQIFIHGFITANGQKMSKSLGNVIDPLELVSKYGTDAVRYYLLREVSPTEDGDFSYGKFEAKYNSDLASGIGNLVSRVFGIALKTENFDFLLPNVFSNKELKKSLSEAEKKYLTALNEFRFNDALSAIWEVISTCDKYINEEKLWETKKIAVLQDLLLALLRIKELLFPFMPETSERIEKSLSEKKAEALFPRLNK